MRVKKISLKNTNGHAFFSVHHVFLLYFCVNCSKIILCFVKYISKSAGKQIAELLSVHADMIWLYEERKKVRNDVQSI